MWIFSVFDVSFTSLLDVVELEKFKYKSHLRLDKKLFILLFFLAQVAFFLFLLKS